MIRSTMKLIPLAITAALLSGVAWETASRPTPEDAAPFHRQVRDFFESFPYRVGGWVGTDIAETPAAQKLLRPNVMLSRAYRNADAGRSASLLFVQCRDSRDMAGHYPPVCYPAHGWEKEFAVTQERVTVGGVDIPVARYLFERSGFESRHKVVIYGFFVLPGRGFVTSMDAVRQAASDYRVRALGAAQVQILMDATISPEDERTVFAELVGPLTPALELIARGAAGTPGATRGTMR